MVRAAKSPVVEDEDDEAGEQHVEVEVGTLSDLKPTAVLAMPFGKGVIVAKCFYSLWVSAARYGRERLRFAKIERTLVHKARNRLATKIVRDFPDAKRIIFVDDDMGVPWGNPAAFNSEFRIKPPLPERYGQINFFDRMTSYRPDQHIVGAAYFDRKTGSQLQCAFGVGTHKKPGFNSGFRAGSIRGIIPMPWVATGAMSVSMDVIKTMMERADEIPEIKPKKEGGIWGFFNMSGDNGEDVEFCFRARKLGFNVFLDADLRVMHNACEVFY